MGLKELRLEEPLQERLINWGYAACAALQTFFEPQPALPTGFTYATVGV
jgi:hypothetical protein